MFSREFDIVLSLIFGILTILFFLGKGAGVLKLFGGRYTEQEKRTPEEEAAYQRRIAWFLLPLTIAEILSVIFPSAIMGFVLAGVAIVDLIIYARQANTK